MWRFLAAVQLLPILEGGEETLVGGQAVLEGVMMRSPHAFGIACRKQNGEVVTYSEPLEKLSEKHKWMGWPIMRGVITLGHAMTLGFRALKFSANIVLDELQPPSEKEEEPGKKKFEISGWVAAVNIVISLGFFIFMYKYLPLVAATELKRVESRRSADRSRSIWSMALFVWSCFWDSSGRLRCCPTFTGLRVSRRRAQNRLCFRKRRSTGNCSSPEVPTYHPRCGTSFLMTVMIISIFVYT